jgi:hypothetical protein
METRNYVQRVMENMQAGTRVIQTSNARDHTRRAIRRGNSVVRPNHRRVSDFVPNYEASFAFRIGTPKKTPAEWTPGGSRLRESRTYGSVRGARGNSRPSRENARVHNASQRRGCGVATRSERRNELSAH